MEEERQRGCTLGMSIFLTKRLFLRWLQHGFDLN